jgi:general transcription factor IIIA
VENCSQAYGYKHLLQRHLAKTHIPPNADPGISTDSSSEGDDSMVVLSPSKSNVASKPSGSLDIDTFTGQSYAKRARANIAESKALRCPYPDVDISINASTNGQGAPTGPSCQYAFSRAYDLRRHLKATHNIDSTKESVGEWVMDRKKGIHTRLDLCES